VAATAGNPFFVTEMLTSPNADVRAIVAHAVRPRPGSCARVVAALRRQPSTAESTEQMERRLLSAPDLLHT
jgi:hypothetical protein